MADIGGYREVFRPGAPMEDRYFFFGREPELRTLKGYLDAPGTHPLIIGERAVGKTSVALHAFGGGERRAIFITVDALTTFTDFAGSVMRGLRNGRSGNGAGSEEVTTPWRLFEELRRHGDQMVIVVDEYENVLRSRTDLNAALVALIKKLADNNRDCDARIAIVGITDPCEAIFAEHQSIERSVKAVSVGRLAPTDLSIFLSRAERRLGFRFAPGVKEAIIVDSAGAPYYVHLVALKSIEAMLARDKRAREVTPADLFAGTEAALHKGLQRNVAELERNLMHVDDGARAVLRKVASYGGARGVPRGRLQDALDRSASGQGDDAMREALRRLLLTGSLLETTRDGHVRFTDPLLAPLIRLHFTSPADLAGLVEKQLDLI